MKDGTMPYSRFRALGLLLSALLLPAIAGAALPCSKAGFDELNRDKANTAYFLDDAADKACLTKPYVASGSVNQVYGKDELEVMAEDGLRVTVILGAAHGCGDLLNIKKGQQLRVKGLVARTYRSVAALRLKDGSCQ